MQNYWVYFAIATLDSYQIGIFGSENLHMKLRQKLTTKYCSKTNVCGSSLRGRREHMTRSQLCLHPFDNSQNKNGLNTSANQHPRFTKFVSMIKVWTRTILNSHFYIYIHKTPTMERNRKAGHMFHSGCSEQSVYLCRKFGISLEIMRRGNVLIRC